MSNDQPKAANTVPGSLAQALVTMRYTFLDYLRSRRFLILLTIGLLISALLTVVVGYYRPYSDPLSFYSGWWGTTAGLIVELSGIFFGGDAVSAEFQNKTGYFTLPNPIRRSSIYLGKLFAAFIASTIILLVFTAITIGNGIYYFGLDIPSQFGESFLFAWLFLVAVLGFAFLFSSLFKSSSYSILVSFLLLFVVFGILSDIIQGLVKTEPWFLLTYGAGIINNVLTVPFPPHITAVTGPGGRALFQGYNATVPEGIAIMAVYFAVTAVVGLFLFERKEFN